VDKLSWPQKVAGAVDVGIDALRLSLDAGLSASERDIVRNLSLPTQTVGSLTTAAAADSALASYNSVLASARGQIAGNRRTRQRQVLERIRQGIGFVNNYLQPVTTKRDKWKDWWDAYGGRLQKAAGVKGYRARANKLIYAALGDPKAEAGSLANEGNLNRAKSDASALNDAKDALGDAALSEYTALLGLGTDEELAQSSSAYGDLEAALQQKISALEARSFFISRSAAVSNVDRSGLNLRFHEGGTVPGPSGSERWARVKGGEQYYTENQNERLLAAIEAMAEGASGGGTGIEWLPLADLGGGRALGVMGGVFSRAVSAQPYRQTKKETTAL
jgi:hypothetical protein